MKRRQFLQAASLGLAATAAAKPAIAQTSPAIAQETEKLFASDVVVRTMLACKVPDAAVQKTLAAGWEINAPETGPDKGANLIVPAKKSGSALAAFMVTGGFVAQANAPGPYGNFSPAKVTVDRRSQSDGDGKTVVDETWTMKADDGTGLEFRVQFQRGVPAREKVAWGYYSAIKPDFHRTYRIEHGLDVVHSVPAGVDRVSTFSFKAVGPKLSPFFDGSERLISMTSIPYYSRSIYLPA